MRFIAAALVLALATACGSSRPAPRLGTREDVKPVATAAPGNFRLYVSNQSFDRPGVDIEVLIDGVRVAAQEFAVEGQHNWIEFGIELMAGEHRLRAESRAGEAEFTKTFRTGAKNWAVLDYWCCGEPDDPRFTFTLSDRPFAFG
jgi:hypothetical protein